MEFETRNTIMQIGPAPLDKLPIETADVITAPTKPVMTSVQSSSTENTATGDISKSEIQRVGATIQDTGDLSAVSIHTGTQQIQSRNPRGATHLNDAAWDLMMLEQKFTFNRNVDWPTTAASKQILTSIRIPQDIIVTPAQKSPFDVTRLWNCVQARLRIVVKASPMYQGSLGFGFVPFANPVSTEKMINMGALICNVSQNKSFEFIIPYRYRTAFLDVTKNEELGTFHIFVISSLQTGASNPNSIEIAVWSAMEGSEFKLPEPVPSTRYFSHKFDTGKLAEYQTRRTIMQSGQMARENKTLVDINAPISSLEPIMMCAGPGLLGSNEIEQFQDMPNDLIQLCKRWQQAGRYTVTLKADVTGVMRFRVTDLMEAATFRLGRAFSLWRGSINARFVVRNTGAFFSGRITFDNKGLQDIRQTISGYSYFTEAQIGMVTIPWIFPYFTDFTPATGFGGSHGDLVVSLETEVNRTITLELYLSVGDDFHMGVYNGWPSGKPLEWNPVVPYNYTETPTRNDGTYPLPPNEPTPDDIVIVGGPKSRPINMSDSLLQFVTRRTQMESGIISFVDRALETTLPIVEKISALGNLLDAHMITDQPPPMQIRNIPYSIASDLPQFTERLRSTNHNALSLPDKYCFGVSEAETNIHKLLTDTKSWIGNYSWKASAKEGDVILDLYNGPESNSRADGQLHDVLPNLFEYWQGSTIYIFDVIASELHRGQLTFVFNTAPDDIAYADATQTYFTTFDLSEGRGTIAIQLPYLSESPYKEVAGNALRGPKNATGILKCFVQNPLRSSNVVYPDVEIVAYKTYGKDFRLGIYGNTEFA